MNHSCVHIYFVISLLLYFMLHYFIVVSIHIRLTINIIEQNGFFLSMSQNMALLLKCYQALAQLKSAFEKQDT